MLTQPKSASYRPDDLNSKFDPLNYIRMKSKFDPLNYIRTPILGSTVSFDPCLQFRDTFITANVEFGTPRIIGNQSSYKGGGRVKIILYKQEKSMENTVKLCAILPSHRIFRSMCTASLCLSVCCCSLSVHDAFC
jgi:hypothetical protein